MKNSHLIKDNQAPIAGLFAVACFFILRFISFLFYPEPYSFFNNWISDLGNVNYNPQGAIYSNLSCLFTGFFLLIFFSHFTFWKRPGIGLKVAKMCGFLSAVFLVLLGIFPENYKPWHGIWASMFFSLLIIFLLLTLVALGSNTRFPNSLSYFGMAVLLINILFIIFYITKPELPIPFFEWLAIITSLGFISAFCYIGLKKEKYK